MAASGGSSVGSNTDTVPADEQAPAVGSTAHVAELAAIRQRHHERYQQREKEREEAAQKADQEKEDEELAQRLMKEAEEDRLRQLEEDEALSRQLAAQLNAGATEHPMQDLGASGGGPPSFDAEDREPMWAQYHQMEDGGEYRAPMRTGYVDRLIEPPQEHLQAVFAPFLGAGAGDARQPVLRRGPFCSPAMAAPLACVVGVLVVFVFSMAFRGGK